MDDIQILPAIRGILDMVLFTLSCVNGHAYIVYLTMIKYKHIITDGVT